MDNFVKGMAIAAAGGVTALVSHQMGRKGEIGVGLGALGILAGAVISARSLGTSQQAAAAPLPPARGYRTSAGRQRRDALCGETPLVDSPILSELHAYVNAAHDKLPPAPTLAIAKHQAYEIARAAWKHFCPDLPAPAEDEMPAEEPAQSRWRELTELTWNVVSGG